MENLEARRKKYLEDCRREKERQGLRVKKTLNEARDQIDKDACRAAFETQYVKTGHFGNALAFFSPCTQQVESIPRWYELEIKQWERDNPGYVVREKTYVTDDGRGFSRNVHMTLDAFPEFSEK